MTERREMTMADVMGYVGRYLADRRAARKLGEAAPEGCGSGGGCGSGSCACSGGGRPAAGAPGGAGREASACSCGGDGGCGGGGADAPAAVPDAGPPTEGAPEPPGGPPPRPEEVPGGSTVLDKPVDRRQALGMMAGGVAAGASLASACSPASLSSAEKREEKLLEWEEYFKGNFRLMTDREKAETIERLERLAELRQGVDVSIGAEEARPGVVYGYAFNISKCKGYRNCVTACINENNLDRETDTQYIRIFEMENGEEFDDLGHGDATYEHAVPAEGHFYVGTQCFQCANPPCVEVCPVNATWQEPDGITVVDYDWCIGCRYCMAACPYWARRFNWSDPDVPADEVNRDQHYLGNRARKKGVVEKCTFCIQRSRKGELPACVEACPTGARVFGNLLDPDSEIRWVLENKRVFRLKEELGTEPRFWYFMD